MGGGGEKASLTVPPSPVFKPSSNPHFLIHRNSAHFNVKCLYSLQIKSPDVLKSQPYIITDRLAISTNITFHFQLKIYKTFKLIPDILLIVL